jgi:uncharacterized membrane protein YkoI
MIKKSNDSKVSNERISNTVQQNLKGKFAEIALEKTQ